MPASESDSKEPLSSQRRPADVRMASWRAWLHVVWRLLSLGLAAGCLLHLVHLLVVACLWCASSPAENGSLFGRFPVEWKPEAAQDRASQENREPALAVRGKMLTGQAPPNARLSIVTGRHETFAYSNMQGRYETWVDLPPIPVGVTIFSRPTEAEGTQKPDEESRLVASTPYIPAWRELPPSIDVAIHVPKQHVLWVSGQVARAGSLRVETSAGKVLGSGEHDDSWLYDLVIKDCPPDIGVIRVIQQDRQGVDLKQSEAKVSLAQSLPLRRKIEAGFHEGLATVKFEVAVPETHPAFRLFAQGWLPLDAFRDRFVSAPIWYKKLKKVQEPAFEMIRAGGSVTVRWAQQNELVVDELWFGTRYGLALMPWLSAGDSTRITFDDLVRLGWVSGPLPPEARENEIAWHGPSEEGVINSVQLKVDPSLRIEPGRREKAAEEAKPASAPQLTMKDYVATDQSAYFKLGIRQLWSSLVISLPFIGVLWVGWRGQFGSRVMWGRMTGAVVVMMFFCGWFTAYRLGLDCPGSEAVRAMVFSFLPRPAPDDRELRQLIANSFNSAFLIALAAVASMTPVWLSNLEKWMTEGGVLALPAGPSRRAAGRWLRRLRMTVLLTSIGAALGACYLPMVPPERVMKAAARMNSVMPDYAWTEALLQDDVLVNILLGGCLPLIAAACLFPALLMVGWRGLLFGCGLVFFALQSMKGFVLFSRNPWTERMMSKLPAVQWPAAVLLVIVSLPLLTLLLRAFVPALARSSSAGVVRAAALIIAVLCAAQPFVGGKWVLFAAEAVLFSGLLWAVVGAVRGARGLDVLERCFGEGKAVQRWVMGIVVTLLVALPVKVGGMIPLLPEMFRLLGLSAQAMPVLAGLFLMLQFREHALNAHAGDERAAGFGALVFFSLFVVQNPSTWLFVPVPYIAGWLMARYWLLHEGPDIAGCPGDAREMIGTILSSKRADQSLSAIEKNLGKKMEAAALLPDAFEERMRKYWAHFRNGPAVTPGQSADMLRSVVLAGWHPWCSAMTCCGYGALMALVPVLVTLYQFLPGHVINHPFPTAELLAVLVRSAASWLFIAFFLGYFFPRIRGDTGLAKGAALSLAIIAPLAVYRLLNVPSLVDLQPFLLWAGQVFVYCTLLGVFAADHRVLAKNGFRWRDLRTIYELPWLSVYASSLIATVTSAGIAVFTGRVGDLVKFFIETVLGKGRSS